MIVKYNLLPFKIVNLRKRALGDTFGAWRRSKKLREYLFNTLDEGNRVGLVKKGFIDKARNEIISLGKCFGIVMFILWYKDFFKID